MYERKIQHHRDLGFDPWVAGGIWTWNRMYAALPFTFKASQACLVACKKMKTKNFIVTVWGDDGSECDLYSALPAIAYFGAQGYTANNDIDWALLKCQFAAVSGGCFDDWVRASDIDSCFPGTLKTQDGCPVF